MISMIDFKKNIYLHDRINISIFHCVTIRPSSEQLQTYWNGLSYCQGQRRGSQWSDHFRYFSASSDWIWGERRQGGPRCCTSSALLSLTSWLWRLHWGPGTSGTDRRCPGCSHRPSAVSGRGSCSGLSSGAPDLPGSGLGSGSEPCPVVAPGGGPGVATLTGTGPAVTSLEGICNTTNINNQIFQG